MDKLKSNNKKCKNKKIKLSRIRSINKLINKLKNKT